jgi:GxxExxY protein
MPLQYKAQRLDCGYRLDIVVQELVIVEVKAVARIMPIHCARLRSCLRMSKLTVGLLLNCNVKWFVHGGVRRIVNGFVD